MSSPVDMMVARLERVKVNGKKGWTARCPAHEDKSSSLSVTEGGDGRVLLNCFAGCGALDIVQALGMEMKDLFVNRPRENMSQAERSELHERHMRSKWIAALDILSQEATVVMVAARQMEKGRKPSPASMERLNEAHRRISDAKAILKTGPNNRRQAQWRPKR